MGSISPKDKTEAKRKAKADIEAKVRQKAKAKAQAARRREYEVTAQARLQKPRPYIPINEQHGVVGPYANLRQGSLTEVACQPLQHTTKYLLSCWAQNNQALLGSYRQASKQVLRTQDSCQFAHPCWEKFANRFPACLCVCFNDCSNDDTCLSIFRLDLPDCPFFSTCSTHSTYSICSVFPNGSSLSSRLNLGHFW